MLDSEMVQLIQTSYYDLQNDNLPDLVLLASRPSGLQACGSSWIPANRFGESYRVAEPYDGSC